MSVNSTRKPRSRKAAERPKKPYADFPLTPHASGKWMKKIRGRIHYFGNWAKRANGQLVRVEGDGWEQALALYKAQADDLHAGRTPRINTDGLTVADLCNRFLTAKQRKMEAREIGQRMFGEYKATTDRLVATFGAKRRVDDIASDDFESLRADLAKQFGPVRLGNEITRIKSVFKYASDNGLLDKPVRYGSEFKKPGKAVLRKHKVDAGGNMMEAEEIRKLLNAADPATKAMLLLGVNCGFGPTDCATLPLDAVDLNAGWIDYARPKTGIARRCPLWPETVQALKDALAVRPTPKHETDAKLVFISARGNRFISCNAAHPVTVVIVHLMKTTKVHREGRGPYTMRHVFRTVADDALDRVAIDLIMGHSDPSMGGHYRERIDDSRLVAVAEHVRTWLFGKPVDGATTGADDGTIANENTEASDAADEAHQRGHERPVLKLFAS
jgi:integrase